MDDIINDPLSFTTYFNKVEFIVLSLFLDNQSMSFDGIAYAIVQCVYGLCVYGGYIYCNIIVIKLTCGQMVSWLFWLIFKVISIAFKMFMCLEMLLSEFVRYIFIPLYIYHGDKSKIIKDISSIHKKPTDEVTLAIDISINKESDLQRTVLKIIKYARIIQESINPQQFNCYFATIHLDQHQFQHLKHTIQSATKSFKINVIYDRQAHCGQRLVLEKAKITPFVVIFSSFPSIISLPPKYLIGAEIYFAPEILKTMDYDIYSAFNRYAISQQRKGK